jgi:hypothetical protein
MITRRSIASALFLLLVLLPALSEAAPVTATFNGTVTAKYQGVDLLPYLPLGTHVSFSVNFNDVGSDGVVTPNTETIGPVSGSLEVDGQSYLLSGFRDWFHYYGWSGWGYSAGFTGSGPDVGGGYFSGLYLGYDSPDPLFFPNSPVGWENVAWLGYGFVQQGGGTSFGYLTLTGDLSVNPMPEPAVLALLCLGLIGIAVTRRRTLL